MSTFPTIPPGMGWPFVDATTGEFQSAAVKSWIVGASAAQGTRALVDNDDSARSAMKVLNDANNYALKIDQDATDGAHDAVNISALFGGAHTPFSVNSGNETLSTVKIVNHGVQTGGAVIAAVGEHVDRIAALFGADNYGNGPSFLSSVKAGAGVNAAAIRAAYDSTGGATYTAPILYATPRHTAGHLLYVENDQAHTSGSMVRLVEGNAGATVPIISIANAGSGDSISAPDFSVTKNGRVRVLQIENLSSFNNGVVQMQSTGVRVNRNVSDANPVLQVRNEHASNTGDVIQVLGAGAVLGSRFNKNAHFMTRKNAAPADGDLANGELAIWFDSTNGAAKVMFKAKETGGTVRTGQVALS